VTTVTGISDANWNIDSGTAAFDDPNGQLEVAGVSGDNIVGAHDQRTLDSVDHYAKATVSAFTWAGAERQVGVCTRYVNTGAFTGYSMEVDDGGGTIIIEVTGASPNTIASGSSSAVTVGDEIMAVSEGTGHRLYINGALALSANDTAHTTETRGGLHFHTDSASSTLGWGAWQAGALSDIYPTVAATNTGATTAGGSFSVPMPAGIAAGELLLIWAAHDSNGTSTALAISGWTQLFQSNNGTVVRHGCWAKIAAGSDTATITGSANDTATVSARITGHGVTTIATDIKVGTAATGSTATPNPPSLNTGASADYLWFESFGADDDDNAATYWTTGFAGVAQAESAQTTSSCMVGVARMSHTAQTLDPGTMAMAATEEWVANTIAIPPAAVSNTGTVAETQDGQTSTASGWITVTGTLAETQDAQTSTASGILGYTGSLAETQDAQTPTASGTATGNEITGTLAETQTDQTSTAAGNLGYSGTLARTQTDQIAAATGILGYTGTLTLTQAAQTSTAAGQLGYSGTLTETQDAQTSTASGTVGGAGEITGTLAETQDTQTPAASGQLGYSGVLEANQANQTAAASGWILITGTVAETQAAQTATAAGTVAAPPITGTLGRTQADQISTATGWITIFGLVVRTQAGQVCAATGFVGEIPVIPGVLTMIAIRDPHTLTAMEDP